MTEKTLKRIAIALGVAAVLYAVVWAVASLARPAVAGPGGAFTQAVERLKGDTLMAARFVAPQGDTIALRREAGGWMVNGYEADAASVESLQRALSGARVTDLVARSPDSHARLGVAEGAAWDVEFRGRERTVRLLLGTSGRDFASVYARLPDADEVYDLAGGIRTAVTRELAHWRNKAIVRVDTSRVRTIAVERGAERYTLVHHDTAWRALDGARTAAVDSVSLAHILEELARLEGIGFAHDTVAFAGAQSRRVVALAAAGDTLAVIELAGEDYNWLARARGNAQVYELAGFRAERLAPPRIEVIRPEG